MESKPSLPTQPVNFPLRPGEQVVFVTRWDGGWANSIATYVLFGILFIVGLFIVGDFWAFFALVMGFSALLRLIFEVLSRINGRAVLTDQRIVVKGMPSPWISKEIELTDVQGLNAGVDLIRAGGGMSAMTVNLRSGKKQRIVLPNASRFAEAYNARVRV